MRHLIHERDLRTLFSGAAAVVVAGLVAGSYMHPNLRAADALGGPQMLAGVSGARAHGYDTGQGWSYQGQTPDYVIGTDWLKPPQMDDIDKRIAAMGRYDGDSAPVMAYAAEEHAADAIDTRAQDPAPEPVSYPSVSGGRYYESDLPAPPAPPAEDDTTVPTVG